MLGFAFGNALSKGTKTQVIFVSAVSLNKYIWLHIMCQSTSMPTFDKTKQQSQLHKMTQFSLMLTLQTSCILRTGSYHTDQGKKKEGKEWGIDEIKPSVSSDCLLQLLGLSSKKSCVLDSPNNTNAHAISPPLLCASDNAAVYFTHAQGSHKIRNKNLWAWSFAKPKY